MRLSVFFWNWWEGAYGLFECGYGAEVGMVFELDVFSAVVGAVELATGVYPGGYFEQLFFGEVDAFVTFS